MPKISAQVLGRLLLIVAAITVSQPGLATICLQTSVPCVKTMRGWVVGENCSTLLIDVDVIVKAGPGEDDKEIIRTRTNSEGYYEMNNLSEGTYYVFIYAKGYPPGRLKVRISHGIFASCKYLLFSINECVHVEKKSMRQFKKCASFRGV